MKHKLAAGQERGRLIVLRKRTRRTSLGARPCQQLKAKVAWMFAGEFYLTR